MTTSISNNSSNSSLSLPSDYLNTTVPDQYAIKIKFIVGFIQLFVLLIGLFGNILALIVINKKSLKNTSSSVFITYMAIFDSAVLIFHSANLIRPRRNLFIHCSLGYLTGLFTFCANWVLVIITLERCIAVSSPFYAKRFCTVYSARYSIYILLAVAIIISSSTFPIFYTNRYFNPNKYLNPNKDLNPNKCHIRDGFALIVRVYETIVFYGIPDILLLSNLFTIYSLIRRRKQQTQRFSDNEQGEMRVSDVHSNRKQRQLTIMLVTVNLTFYLFTTPALLDYITEYTPPKDPKLNELQRAFLFKQISVILLQLNNATNFIFYCFAGRRFRQATIQTFHNFSTRLIIFYHRYILCNKDYRPSINYQLKHLQHTATNRNSNPERLKHRSDIKQTI